MLRSNCKAVLIDFGIAKQIIPATQSSTDKSAHERFAPYEQRYRGSRDPRVDIYCLAASLYYGVTGQNPTNSLARKLDNERLIPPQELISSISKELNQAILNGMALEAKDRPQSMQSWLKILNYKPQVSSSEVEVPIVVTPPQVEEFHRKEVIHGKYRSGIEYTTDKKTKIKIIPWLWLISLLLFHTLMSYILAASHAPFWAVAWAMVWAGVEAMFWLATIDLDSYIFLIVTGTSNLGLGLGWIVYRLFNPS
ncbi:hypothetical protein MEN41_14425 [Dolichospermum sp. ST_con]|nr:hypothetical protein [Dolichospermum sp. ST_con]